MKNLVLMGGISMLALAVAACGDDTGDGSGGSGSSTTSTGETTSATTSSTTSATTTTTSTTGSAGGDGGGGGTGDGGAGGTGDGGAGGTGDGGGGGGGAPASVVEVDCAGATIAETIGTMGITAFDPAEVTIAVGDVIQFTPTGFHDMTSDEGLFATPTGDEACLRFDAVGDYPFHCSQHPVQMVGTVTVE